MASTHHTTSADAARAFPLVGNLVCLDLVNTEVVSRGSRVDLLRNFEDVMRWAKEAGLATAAEERAAVAEWRGTRQGAAALEAAVTLRHALRAMAEALADGRSPGLETVAAINDVLARGASVLRLERRGGVYETRRHVLERGPATVLAPVAESAAWLLERGDRAHVRRCENPACILFFYDTTKNKTRRWCAMDSCGSRAKAAAYYRRTRAASLPGRRSRL